VDDPNDFSVTTRLYTLTDLGTFGGGAGAAMAVSASGRIAAWSGDETGTGRAVLWHAGSVTVADAVPSCPYGVNDAGAVVGDTVAADLLRPFLWIGPELIELATGGKDAGSVRGINHYGWSV